jgi:ribosomal protein L29
MKRKDITTLAGADIKELKKDIETARKNLATLLLNRYTKPSKNVREAKEIKKKIAVMLTFVKQKEITHV